MAFDGTTKGWFPTLPITLRKTTRLQTAKFGDGYEQRMLDGINAYDKTWAVSFENRPRHIIKSMDEYLEEQKGMAFQFWHSIDEVTYNVFCDEWQIDFGFRKWQHVDGTKQSVNYGTLTAEFRKANGVGI